MGLQQDLPKHLTHLPDTILIPWDALENKTLEVSSGYFVKNNGSNKTYVNNWIKGIESSKQYQILTYTYDGTSNVFQLDVTPYPSTSIPNVKVYWFTKQQTKKL